MALVLPIDASSSFYSAKVTLDGTVYQLEARWNERMGKWLLNLLNAAGTPLVMGLPILEAQPLFDQVHAVTGVPAYEIVARDMKGLDRDPDRDTLGGDVVVFYAGT